LHRKMESARLEDRGEKLDAEFGEYARLVLSNNSDAFYFHIMLTKKDDDDSFNKPIIEGLLDSGLMGNTWPTNRICTNETKAYVDVCSADEAEACSNTPMGPRYPLFDGDVVDYEVLFLQPPQVGGAHLDDNFGTSYFFLHLIEGRKVMRLWPFFQNGALQDWYCSQADWNITSTPPHLFLGGEFGRGFKHERWAERGFEFGVMNAHLASTDGDTDATQTMCQDRQDSVHQEPRAGYCFVEVEMGPGDEMFVPSGIPHQITTLAPSIAISANVRFSTLSDMQPEDLEELLSDTGMSTSDISEIRADVDEDGFEIGSIVEAIDAADSFNISAWKRRLVKTPPRDWLAGMLERRDEAGVIINALVGTLQRNGDFLQPKPGRDGWPCWKPHTQAAVHVQRDGTKEGDEEGDEEADIDAAEDTAEQTRHLEAKREGTEEGDEEGEEEADSDAAEDVAEQDRDMETERDGTEEGDDEGDEEADSDLAVDAEEQELSDEEAEES